MTRIVPPRDLVAGIFAAGLVAVPGLAYGERELDRSEPMQTTALSLRDENAIEASVTIQRAVDEVFGFYRDFKNLPRSWAT
jgi:hypothetical protein